MTQTEEIKDLKNKTLNELDCWLQYQAEQEDYIEDTSTEEGAEIYNAHMEYINKLRKLLKIIDDELIYYNEKYNETLNMGSTEFHSFIFGRLSELQDIVIRID